MITFQVYTVKESNTQKEFGLGGSVVLSLVNAAGVESNKEQQNIF